MFKKPEIFVVLICMSKSEFMLFTLSDDPENIKFGPYPLLNSAFWITRETNLPQFSSQNKWMKHLKHEDFNRRLLRVLKLILKFLCIFVNLLKKHIVDEKFKKRTYFCKTLFTYFFVSPPLCYFLFLDYLQTNGI